MKKGNLLIIDDEEMILSGLKEMLEDVTDNILMASGGDEGLSILYSNEIHAIVCDINMPGKSGVEVIKEVRSKKIETPFIFYTGFGSRELMMEAIKYGAFDFVEKPNVHGLEEIVVRALKYGLSGKIEEIYDQNTLISEYQALVKKIKS